MGDGTKIEWTRGDDGSLGATWNPLVGCEHAGPGCDRCYAARESFGRLRNLPAYKGLAVRHIPTGQIRFTGEVRTLPERLDQPLKWKRPRRIFVNSMSDLFHPSVPDEYIERVFATMLAADRHTFQVLTKRPQRMAAFTQERYPEGLPWHIWLGTSIESPRYAFRSRHAVESTTQVPWLSIEPLVEGIGYDYALSMISGVKWVVLGGESGPGARWMLRDWARTIRDVCLELDVPFLLKQWGEWSHDPDGVPIRLGKKYAGRSLDGRTWDQYPEREAAVHG